MLVKKWASQATFDSATASCKTVLDGWTVSISSLLILFLLYSLYIILEKRSEIYGDLAVTMYGPSGCVKVIVLRGNLGSVHK